MTIFIAAIAGVTFGIGLTVSQMTNPNKVLAFLDLRGDWDPSLMLVLVSAVLVTTVGYRLAWKRSQPICEPSFQIPTRKDLDARLLIGSIIFGVGWGLAGFCPGPALAALLIGSREPWLFVLAMFIGFALARQITSRRST